MQNKKLLFSSLVLSTLLLSGCGSGGNQNSEAQQTAIEHIFQYAQNQSNTPTLQDYLDAGVRGVTAENLDEVNALVATLTKEDVDTKEEIQALVDELNLNIVPTVNAGDNQNVQVNHSITLSGSGSDTDGTIVSYEWKEGSTVLAHSSSFSYTPTTTGEHTLTLTVTDNDGATASDSLVVTVTETIPNHVPTSQAGSNQSVEVNHSITLSGSGSDTDGTIVSYEWKEGSTVLAHSSSFSYTPTTTGEHTLTLIVTDNDGATASDSMVVTATEAQERDTLHITEEYQVNRLGKETSIALDITIDTDDNKDLYLVLSNYDSSDEASVSISHSNKNSEKKNIQKKQTKKVESPTIKSIHAPSYIETFNSKLLKADIQTAPNKKIISTKSNATKGDTHTFYLSTSDTGETTDATLKAVISDIDTNMGTKTLNLWVSDDSFGDDCGKKECVTQEMVDALADQFLKDGSDNDVYDWVTNVFGEEWESDAKDSSSNLIEKSDNVDILLTDIDDDNSNNGGIVGYFWAKDNYESSELSGSNERIMFYIDAIMFANGDGSWDIDDMWPKEIVSTLAHEFQHMIHFYQKTVPTGESTDTWINEMLSETTEDLVATKIQHIGPRGVSHTDGSAGSSGNRYGRYPLFNENNTLSLTTWGGGLKDYSKVSAFGTFLTRNYGGAQVLHDIVHNNKTDERAVVEGVQNSDNGEDKTFDDLLREWGVAVMLSSIESPSNLPTYNTGDFINNTYEESTYKLGSINFFNYDSEPTIYTDTGDVEPQGNYYYKIGEDLSGTISVDISLNGTTEATLIAK